MNVEIGTGAPIFLFWEYLFQIFGIMSLQCMDPAPDSVFCICTTVSASSGHFPRCWAILIKTSSGRERSPTTSPISHSSVNYLKKIEIRFFELFFAKNKTTKKWLLRQLSLHEMTSGALWISAVYRYLWFCRNSLIFQFANSSIHNSFICEGYHCWISLIEIPAIVTINVLVL